MNRHSQKGSALLIVLGFLSFMVVSAVAFAIWMRTERLPSSALRRTIANRYLVKAALAQAMSRVDDAIRSHIFPGAWNTNDQKAAYRDMKDCAYDWWESRVFMPPDPEGKGTTSGDPYSRYAPATKTVSVLNLEALGYLPPSIANDVRFLSRSSWAAQWDYFNFDAGRYAFCAVNVSDMLDITKIAADAPRTSASAAHAKASGEKPAPSRFSLAYLFRKNYHDSKNDDFGDVTDGDLEKFDQIVHTSHEWLSAPLVSVMDYNLSVGETTMGNFYSPFVEWVTGLNSKNGFYRGTTVANGPDVKGAERQPFVTDSWFPQSAGGGVTLSKAPPFKKNTLDTSDANDLNFALMAQEPDFWRAMANDGHAFCMMDQFALFDYLDMNDLPVSLAMPCVEREPMFAALGPVGKIQVEFVPPGLEPSEIVDKDNKRRKYYDTKIKVTATGMGLGASLVYPFKGGPAPYECKVQAFGRIVFVVEELNGGGAASTVSLRNSKFARNFRPLNEDEWTAQVDEEKQFMLEEGATDGVLTHDSIENCMLVTMPSVGEETWTPRATMQRAGDCWQDKFLRFKDAIPKEGKTILRKVEIYDVTSPTPTNPKGTETLRETKYQIALCPFDANGIVVRPEAIDENGELSEAAFDALAARWVVRPYLVTWARITRDHVFPGNAGKVFTVDMVPATYEDDKAFNKVDNTNFKMPEVNLVLGNSNIQNDKDKDPSPQKAMPIMRFPSDMTFSYSDVKDAAKSGTTHKVPEKDWSVKACYAVDPRYNWAPENWWFDSSADMSGQRWHDAVFVSGGTSGKGILDDLVQAEYDGAVSGRGDRANDPFLFVSSLGYLQSVGELAFLPHLSDLHESNKPECILGDARQDIESGSHAGKLYDGKARGIGEAATMPCALAAWKSYQNYRTNPTPNTFEFGANLYRRGLVNDPQGFYINPYTQSQEIMLAALANTPLDYYSAAGLFGNAASTASGAQGQTKQSKFSDGKSYMFSNARMSGRDVNKVATFLRRRFEDLAAMIEVHSENVYAYSRAWEDMFDALDWSGTTGCTVKEVYENLQKYYANGGSGNINYRRRYTQANGYPDLNKFALGGGASKVGAGISLNVERAVHKKDFDLDADPLRGRYDGDDVDTKCCDTLHDVDRMFLHSFWRDCFANKQQLFLIFVRAESTALGGAGEGTPAQQGGRAVALVWRDPMPPTVEEVYENDDKVYHKDRHPHKMRILFYRQFD